MLYGLWMESTYVVWCVIFDVADNFLANLRMCARIQAHVAKGIDCVCRQKLSIVW